MSTTKRIKDKEKWRAQAGLYRLDLPKAGGFELVVDSSGVVGTVILEWTNNEEVRNENLCLGALNGSNGCLA